MAEMNEGIASASDESTTVEESTESSDYPSACFLLDSCVQDYQRLQENYNRIYDKINVALAFEFSVNRGSWKFDYPLGSV